ncbi:MAG: hypothetical protein IJW73_04770 [Candidatus Gastranaerophilales bacterium]|nr:hypothetical protein [Candidatus Gastranaerophilales bacterium]
MNLEQFDEKSNSLQILKVLIDGKISKSKLLELLQIKASTFYKHLNLMREIGFNISRDNDNYELIYFRDGFKFAKYELSIFVYLLLLAYIMLPKVKVMHLIKAFKKMLCLASKEEYDLVKEKYEFYRNQVVSDCYQDKIIALKKYILENSNALVFIKNGKEIKIKPTGLTFGKNEKIYVKYLDFDEQEKTISLDSIVKISQDNKKIVIEGKDETIFELYGKLAKSYLLKENERIIDSKKDKLIIANSMSDKDVLFRRLLRYDVLCKVTFPKKDVVAFNDLISKTLAKIEGITDNI